jgi:hypothetical protein
LRSVNLLLTFGVLRCCASSVGKLYVADTNNSLIRVLDLQAQGGPKLETLELKGVQPPIPAAPTGPRRLRQRLSSDTQVIRIDPVDALNGDLQLQISLASGYHFSKVSCFCPGSPLSWLLQLKLVHCFLTEKTMVTLNWPSFCFFVSVVDLM